MCGIVGFLSKREDSDYPLGRTLLDMLQALSCRGPDSAGVALFATAGKTRLRLSASANTDRDQAVDVLRGAGVSIDYWYHTGVLDGSVAGDGDPAELEERILRRLPGSEILCLGKRLSLFKQVGSPDQLEATYGISRFRGTHGIGHTRLSTESRVDLSHSQPFWAHGVPDLATVHNGHITNYHKLRRRFEQEGYRFYTENDSEIIGVYLRDRMAAGRSLEGALHSSVEDFDGSFCYLVAARDSLAVVKDRYAFKPLMLAETDDFIALATEEVALRRALGRDFAACEPAPGRVQMWSIHPEVSPAHAG